MGNLTTVLKVGKANAPVSLAKMAAEPKAAQPAVRWIGGHEVAEPEASYPPPLETMAQNIKDRPREDDADPFAHDEPAVLSGTVTETKQSANTLVVENSTVVDTAQRTKTHGVWRGDEWVDLEEQLQAIDKATAIDGMNIEATIRLASIPREMVRDGYYIIPKSPAAHTFCALVWRGLRATHAGAVVRWTKKTNQSLGVIVPRGSEHGDGKPYLMLVQLEWWPNLRPVPLEARIDADISDTAADRATEAMSALYERGSTYLPQLRDERKAQRAELLDAAREGRALPQAPEPDDKLAALGELLASMQS